MLKHLRKLLVIVMVCSVAPASAGQLDAAWNTDEAWPDCPYERARLAAAASEGMTVTLTSMPADGSLLNRRQETYLP